MRSLFEFFAPVERDALRKLFDNVKNVNRAGRIELQLAPGDRDSRYWR